MTTAPTQDEVKLAVALLWEAAEGKLTDEDRRNKFPRIAGIIDRQAAEIERLRQAADGKRAA